MDCLKIWRTPNKNFYKSWSVEFLNCLKYFFFCWNSFWWWITSEMVRKKKFIRLLYLWLFFCHCNNCALWKSFDCFPIPFDFAICHKNVLDEVSLIQTLFNRSNYQWILFPHVPSNFSVWKDVKLHPNFALAHKQKYFYPRFAPFSSKYILVQGTYILSQKSCILQLKKHFFLKGEKEVLFYKELPLNK